MAPDHERLPYGVYMTTLTEPTVLRMIARGENEHGDHLGAARRLADFLKPNGARAIYYTDDQLQFIQTWVRQDEGGSADARED
jgi:hypothetical protein